MIESTSNRKVKDVIMLTRKASLRKEKGLFVVEGIKMFREVPVDDLDEVYASESFYNTCPTDIKVRLRSVRHEIVTDTVYQYMSDTKTPQGIMAIVRMKKYTELTGTAFLILDRIQDPGNLGTILRTAEAAGIDGVLMNNETVDIYNPKVVRSTMGSIFRVPFVYTEDLPKAIKKLGAVVYAAHLKGVNNYDEEDYREPSAFIIGNESSGISDETAMCADKLIRIPMKGEVESLNAGIAASVLMFEMARQRR